MQKTTITCDCCGKVLSSLATDSEKIGTKHIKTESDRLYFDNYELCFLCQSRLIRYALSKLTIARDCKECNGTKKRRIKDELLSIASSTCGENRIEYKTITCDKCF